MLLSGSEALLAQIQSTAGAQWRKQGLADMADMKLVLGAKLSELLAPCDDFEPRRSVIVQSPRQWKQLVRHYALYGKFEQQVASVDTGTGICHLGAI